MRRAINKSVQVFTHCFQPDGPVVELGSLYLPGYKELSDLRPYFAGMDYIGCDIRHGLGVDRIEDAQALSFPNNSIKTFLLLEILEHLACPQQAVKEAHRVLTDDGLLVISVPFNYRLHGFPTDFWRFTASGIYNLLSDFPEKVVFALGPRLKPAFIFAVATKEHDGSFYKKKAHFQAEVYETFHKTRIRGTISVFKERARDFFGHLLGRAELSVVFFDPRQKGGYLDQIHEE